ncbi:hypothetical protein [Haliangium sp.]|uniref:hypothetical protein n=1 Tax=Haliangium sp. TaxID=2663208 RepID=UPI003D1197A7
MSDQATRRARVEEIKTKVKSILTRLRSEYERAVNAAEDNALIWFEMSFFVDQVRHLIVPAAQVGGRWERRSGKALIANRPIPVVEIYVGRGRSFTVHNFLEIMKAMAEDGERPFMDESSLGHFLSLMVVEPHFNPLAEITTLLAVAHALAEGREGDNVFDLIPPTVTTEVDTAAIPGFDLGQHARSSADEIAQREIALIKTIKPDFLTEIDALLEQHDRTEVIRILRDELHDYVRTHLFGRLIDDEPGPG